MKKISKIIEILKKYFRYKRRTTLNRMHKRQEDFKILIACLLSLRTKDEITKKVSEELFKVAKTPEEIVKIPIKKLEKIVFSTGYYKKKARILKSVSRELLARFDGKVPRTKEELLSIKGIGPKTANIVLNFAFGKDELPIDTHCHRIPNRIGLIKTKKPEETEKALKKILPKKYWRDFNAIFVLFGKNICLPTSPLCSKCPIEDYCKKIGVTKTR